MSELFTLVRGESPLLINVPHAGTRVPGAIRARFTEAAAELPDTDWFVDELYAFATGLGAGLLTAHFSRYVIDLNRPPDDQALYAGRGTGLVPVETFNGKAVYRPGEDPDALERSERTQRYWRPVHAALDAELRRLRDLHGHAVLLDAHSIRSELPLLFEGRLPELNLGSFDGASAAPGLVRAAMDALADAGELSLVLDGRFKGGFNTRHYGRPQQGVHALQLEMAQRAYMREQPPRRDPRRAGSVQSMLRRLVATLTAWQPEHAPA